MVLVIVTDSDRVGLEVMELLLVAVTEREGVMEGVERAVPDGQGLVEPVTD